MDRVSLPAGSAVGLLAPRPQAAAAVLHHLGYPHQGLSQEDSHCPQPLRAHGPDAFQRGPPETQLLELTPSLTAFLSSVCVCVCVCMCVCVHSFLCVSTKGSCHSVSYVYVYIHVSLYRPVQSVCPHFVFSVCRHDVIPITMSLPHPLHTAHAHT